MGVKLMRLSGLIYLVCLFLIGCASSQPAPVVERIPTVTKPAAVKPVSKPAIAESASKPATAEKDWRPETYTVKKGDTLISIGLEYGYDYKEIAQKNNIQPPYLIHLGQQLKLKEGKTAAANVVDQTEGDGGVVVTPLKTDSTAIPPATSEPVATNEPPLLKEPKALREPYSEQALAAPAVQLAALPKSAKTAEAAKPSDVAKPSNIAKSAETAKTETPMAETAIDDDEAIEWAWPVQGKILAGFNESTSKKGIDIDGTQGQAVIVSAPGKVIYSGSDLRGYGKLVIVKHNKTYLSVYAHNSKILVKEGQQLSKGQKIAEMGSTDSDRVKLHFEIRRQGKSVDPAKYLSSSPN